MINKIICIPSLLVIGMHPLALPSDREIIIIPILKVGGLIAMAPPISDEAVEYEPDWDGEDPGVGQIAKDITCFLSWCSEPETDARKRLGTKCIFMWVFLGPALFYTKRFRWGPIKNRKITWVV